jgi:hypothetical protein
VTKTLDRAIGKRAYVIKGPIASSNYIEIPNPEALLPADRAPINATGPFIYVEYKPVPGLTNGAMVLFHLDLATSAGPLRVSCCSAFSEGKFAGAGTLRVPLRPSPDGRWTVLALDLPALLALHCPRASGGTVVAYCGLKALKLCSTMAVRGVYTSHSALSPSTLPADMKLPLPKSNASWHETYAWVWCPHPPLPAPANAAAASIAVSPATPLRSRAAEDADDDASELPLSSSTHNRALARTALRPAFPAPKLTASSSHQPNGSNWGAFKLERVIGNAAVGNGSVVGGVAWAGSEVVFPCGRVVVAMGACSSGARGAQRLLPAHHTSAVQCVCVSHGADLAVSSQGGADPKACLWDLPGQRWLCDLESAYAGALIACAFSACDAFLVTVGHDLQRRTLLIVWDVTHLRHGGGGGLVATRQSVVARQLSDFHVSAACFHPGDPSRLVSCGRENVRFWRVSRRHLPGSPAEAPKALGLEHAFRGHAFAAVAFEARAPAVAASALGGELRPALAPALAPAAAAVRVVFVASDQGCVVQVDAATRQVLSFLGLHSAPLTCLVATEG